MQQVGQHMTRDQPSLGMMRPFFARRDFAVTRPLTTPDGCRTVAYTAAETPIPLASPNPCRSIDSIGSSAFAKLLGTVTFTGRFCSYFNHLCCKRLGRGSSQAIQRSQASR